MPFAANSEPAPGDPATVDIWAHAHAAAYVRPAQGQLLRMVESQEQIATNELVDTLAEQALLESLLEAAKPPLVPGSERLHYLLATPFRYPPLRHGSRFGSRFEPSLFYGAERVTTLLAESAFYRLVFWAGMAVAPPAALKTQHTVLGASWGATRTLALQSPPFEAWQSLLMHPGDYAATQRLGRAMREDGVQAFTYRSARDAEAGINVALFSPAAFSRTRPDFTQAWLAETTADGVRFYDIETARVHTFERSQFLRDGQLPGPAA